MANIPPDQLAFEIEDIIRCMPSNLAFSVNPDDCSLWLGRASAAINKWSLTKAITVFDPLIDILAVGGNSDFSVTLRKVRVVLHQALSELRMATAGPLSLLLGLGVFTNTLTKYASWLSRRRSTLSSLILISTRTS